MEEKRKKTSKQLASLDLADICFWTDSTGYPSGCPAGASSEDKISMAVVAVGGTTAGVSEDKLTGVQTGNRLQLHSQSRHGTIRETL